MTKEELNKLIMQACKRTWNEKTCKEIEQALSQEPCDDVVSRQAVLEAIFQKPAYHGSDGSCYHADDIRKAVEDLPPVNPQYTGNEFFNFDAPIVKKSMEQDAISRDFQIGDEVRIIGSDPIYDDCDVGWVIRNASERVKTMYVMRNDGSADEEAKAEWYKTGRHNAVLAEVIKALPSITQKSGKCKNCKYFEYDSVAKVDGIPLIVAHEICNKWGNGCKTKEDGYCFLFEPQKSEGKECR